MKKIFILFLSALIAIMIIPSGFAHTANELDLVQNGKTEYRIVISKNALPVEHTAAETLADYFEKISSAQIQIITDEAEPAEKEIVIGVTNRDTEAEIDRSEYGSDGVIIIVKGSKLFLTGGVERGPIYAVYTFLEEYLNCRWFTKELTVIPESKTITVPAEINYTYVPCFKLRQTYWLFSTMYSDFCAAHKLHGVMAYMSEIYGGPAEEHAINSVHTLQWIITRDMFDEHPEYFGCDENGNRSVNRQPCLSNDDVLKLVTDYALTFFANYNTIFSVSQNDGAPFCQCEKCKSFKKAHGDTDSACMIDFVNRVAENVRRKYPDARLETLAYQDTLTPPSGLSIGKNIVIRMCPVNGCVLHDFDDPDCKKNRDFNNALKGWAELTDNIYMWNYSTDFQYYYALFPNITTLQARYKYFRDNNVIGVFDNGCGENMVPAEFHELKTYLVLKLLWDPDTDIQRHINEFCNAYYGEAGQDIVKFINTFEKDVKGYKPLQFGNAHMTCQDGGESLENNTALTEREIKSLNKIMDSALDRRLTKEQAERVKGVSISWRFFKCGTFSGEFNWFNLKNDPEEEGKKLCRDMKDYGIEFLAEGGKFRITDGEPNCTVRPTWWFADESEMPSSVKVQSKILPVINRILRTVFRFAAD